MCSKIFVILLAAVVVSGQGLYKNRSEVEELTEQSFFDRMSAANESLFIVQFYSSWCGHCHKYAPTWQAMAAGVKGWKPYVVLAAVDCESSYELCRSQHVDAYPTFKYYEPFSKRGDIGKVLQLDATERTEIEALKIKILKTVEKITGSKRANWMNTLNFYDGSIQNELDKGYGAVVFIVERANSYAGRVMIMDHMGERQLRPIFRLKGPQKGMPLPRGKAFAAYIYENGMVKPLETEKRNLAPNQLTQVRGGGTQSWNERSIQRKSTETTGSVYQADLDCGLAYMFKREIPCKKIIKGQTLTLLRDWLNLLLQYLPMSPPVRNSMEAINEVVKQSRETVNTDQLMAAAKVVEKGRYLPDKCYKCTGSKPYYRGYPCALWQILHTLTVQLAKRTSDPNEAVHMYNTIRGYISTFFMCKMCAKHFEERTNHPERVTSPDELVYLIYEVHNQANRALTGTLTEDPQAPKVQFPSKELCPNCNSKEATLQFLKKYYEPDTSVIFVADQKEASKGQSWLNLQEQQNQLSQGLASKDAEPGRSEANRLELYLQTVIYSCLLLSFLLL